MSVLMIVFSIVMIICGIDCIVSPIATFSALGWIAGIAIIVAGVSAIAHYAAGKTGRSIWQLIGGIIGLVFGLFILINSFAQFATNLVIAYAAALWLVFYGISGIIEALNLRKTNKKLPDKFRTASWLHVMILSILMVALGVICMIQPMITFFSVGLLIGIAILFSGIKVLIQAIQIIRLK